MPTHAEILAEELNSSGVDNYAGTYFRLMAEEKSGGPLIVDWQASEDRRLNAGGAQGWFGLIFHDGSILSYRYGSWIPSML